MKTGFFTLLLLVVLMGCQDGKVEQVYQPRALIAGEDFNSYAKEGDQPFTVLKLTEGEPIATADGKEIPEVFTVKFRDTTVKIQSNAADEKTATDKFAVAQFVNTQKTTLLVQIADATGLIAPFYLVSLKNNQLEVVNLYRPSTGKQDVAVTKGMVKVGNSGYLINNDYFVTNVNAKVYPVKRQNPEERIQGEFFIKSSDKQTLVFLMEDSFYEVHYPTGETYTLPFPSNAPKTKSALYPWIQANFSWQKNNKGISFLKKNEDDDKIVDISEFK